MHEVQIRGLGYTPKCKKLKVCLWGFPTNRLFIFVSGVPLANLVSMKVAPLQGRGKKLHFIRFLERKHCNVN